MKGRHKDNVLLGREEPASPQELEMIMKQYSSTLKPRVVYLQTLYTYLTFVFV